MTTPDPFLTRAGEFSGKLWDKSLATGSSSASFPARLLVTGEGIRATLENGDEFILPLKGLRLASSDDGTLIARSGQKRSVTCADPGFLRALETVGGNDLNQEISRLAGEKVGSGGKQLIGCLVAILLALVCWWGIPKLFHKGLDATVNALPITLDESLGEAAQKSMDPGGKVTEDPVLRDAVQAMVDRLEPHAARAGSTEWQFEFRIVESDQVNAFALPGGYITVYTGLIAESETPEQVAGVIAHEMAHVTLRHGMHRIAHSLGLMAGMSLLFGDLGGLESVAVELFTLSTVNGYSQVQESAADAEGVRMMLDARMDPEALANFFRLLEKKYGDVPESVSWLSTHPQHAHRVDAIRAQAAEDGAALEWIPLDLDWESIRAAARD